MAQTVTSAAVGRVNRRFLFLALILAALSAVLVYAALSQSGGDGGGSAGDVPVVVAKSAIAPGTRITAEMVEVRQLPDSAVGFQSLSTTEDVIGQVARYPIAAGEQVLLSKIVDTSVAGNDAIAYVLEAGKRGMSINFEEVTGAGGLVLPGDRVDLIWVPFKGAPGFILMTDIEVTAVSQTIVEVAPSAPGLVEEGQEQAGQAPGERTRTSEADPNPEAISATLMVTPEQSATLLCAENHAEQFDGELRLAVRSFGDTQVVNPNAPPCPPLDLILQILGEQ